MSAAQRCRAHPAPAALRTRRRRGFGADGGYYPDSRPAPRGAGGRRLADGRRAVPAVRRRGAAQYRPSTAAAGDAPPAAYGGYPPQRVSLSYAPQQLSPAALQIAQAQQQQAELQLATYRQQVQQRLADGAAAASARA